MGVGFMVDVIDHTKLALGVPLTSLQSDANSETVNKQAYEKHSHVTHAYKAIHSYQELQIANETSYAILGTRVNFEAYADYRLNRPSFGIELYRIDDACTLVIYPKNAWYEEHIISTLTSCSEPNQTFGEFPTIVGADFATAPL